MKFSLGTEVQRFAAVLAILVGLFFFESLFLGRVLSPADVLLATGSFSEIKGPGYEPANRLLIDPAIQFQPWIAFNREQLRLGRLPLWNPYAGCGAPHLANGQSAVFDPFLLIAYVSELPGSLAWIAAARLWFAGLGMFLLMRRWGAGSWGRWFSGLCFPFCGFLVAWLEYPVVSAAVWLPWLLWASDRVVTSSRLADAMILAACVAGCILGGHIQTSAHVLLLVLIVTIWTLSRRGFPRGPLVAWTAGLLLGVVTASIEIVPLGFYLSRSPVWTDRAAERKSPWILERPRLLDSVCAALPYAFGSQRRGHPNLARGLGVHNLNESVGAFCGLATLLWLAPVSFGRRRSEPIITLLFAVAVFGLAASLRLPPVDNLLRCIPVINVTDNRRLSFWTAFALCALGGFGLDTLARPSAEGPWKWANAAWLGLGILCLVPVILVGRFENRVRDYAVRHYSVAARETTGADPEVYLARAERQTRDLLRFVPRYYSAAAVEFFILAGLLGALRSGSLDPKSAKALLFGLVLIELFGFGRGLNPAIPREDHDPKSRVTEELARFSSYRLLALGAELPPNTSMRYGLRDVRNYDSMEVSETLEWFGDLFESPEGGSRTSRREVNWSGVSRALARLQESSVRLIVSPTPPPTSIPFESSSRIGLVHITKLACRPIAEPPPTKVSPGKFVWEFEGGEAQGSSRIDVREIAVPGWRVWIDDVEVDPIRLGDPFLHVPISSRTRRVVLRYDPIEVRMSLLFTVFGAATIVFGLTLPPLIRSTRIVLERLGRNRAAGLRS